MSFLGYIRNVLECVLITATISLSESLVPREATTNLSERMKGRFFVKKSGGIRNLLTAKGSSFESIPV